MKILLLYWGIMAGCYVLGSKLKNKTINVEFVQKTIMVVVYILVFVIGLRMGANKEIISNLGVIGLKSFVITVAIVGGTMISILIVRKLLRINKYCKGKDEALSEKDADEENNNMTNLKVTVAILILVVIGMVSGYLIQVFEIVEIGKLNTFSDIVLIIWLCILLGLVGFDMGLSGKLVTSIKKAGIRVIIFPFVAVVGTIIFGTITCYIFGFSIKEGIAISGGFGWYTYAPTVITSAGSQHMIAGAVSFMHNVIRETSAIILIPYFARKFGYIEAISMPGVAAMDVCMPIIEKSCGKDMVVYAFAMGLIMCITTSTVVPFVMSL